MGRAGFKGNISYTQDYSFLNHLHWILQGRPQPTCHEGLSQPKLPISNRVASKLREELLDWAATTDKQYKAILAKYGVTENIAFIGGLART